jgi:hypothetical protein
MFICVSLCPGARPGVTGRGETDPTASGSGWPGELHYYLVSGFMFPFMQPSGICEAIHANVAPGITRFVVRKLSRGSRGRAERTAARHDRGKLAAHPHR